MNSHFFFSLLSSLFSASLRLCGESAGPHTAASDNRFQATQQVKSTLMRESRRVRPLRAAYNARVRAASLGSASAMSG